MREEVPIPPAPVNKPWPLEKFYLTFGVQYHQEHHPRWEGADPDGWVVIEAANDAEARELAVAHFGIHWSMLYPAAHFPVELNKQRYYPIGELAVLNAQGLTESVEPRLLRRRYE